MKYPKIKKALQLNGKLLIGLTTKPCYAQGRNVNNTTILNILGEKSLALCEAIFSLTGGLDGTRTRDPMRDRHVF